MSVASQRSTQFGNALSSVAEHRAFNRWREKEKRRESKAKRAAEKARTKAAGATTGATAGATADKALEAKGITLSARSAWTKLEATGDFPWSFVKTAAAAATGGPDAPTVPRYREKYTWSDETLAAQARAHKEAIERDTVAVSEAYTSRARLIAAEVEQVERDLKLRPKARKLTPSAQRIALVRKYRSEWKRGINFIQRTTYFGKPEYLG
jgi:hypothetical protein